MDQENMKPLHGEDQVPPRPRAASPCALQSLAFTTRPIPLPSLRSQGLAEKKAKREADRAARRALAAAKGTDDAAEEKAECGPREARGVRRPADPF